MIKIFTQDSPHPSFLYKYVVSSNMITKQIESADYLLLPFAYEYIYDFSDVDLVRKGITYSELQEMKDIASKYDSLSVQHRVPLIVTFYRDPTAKLPLQNALVFRTSIFLSEAAEHEYGMPAFLEELSDDPGFIPRMKPAFAAVSFRGQMAPLRLKTGVKLRLLYNSSVGSFFPKWRIHSYLVNGYMVRRTAVRSLLNNLDSLILDIKINPKPQQDDYIKTYLNQFLNHDYFLCAAGHGNYSYRLYEIMRSGRIPVFINTDCCLPCRDLIDWKNLVIWIEQGDAKWTAQRILDFHASIHPDDFLELQYQIRHTWENYFTMKGFAIYLVDRFLPNLKLLNAISS